MATNQARRAVTLTGAASQMSWRYEIEWDGCGSDNDRLHLRIHPDASTGGIEPQGQGMDLRMTGEWEAHELITVLQAVVHELVAIIGTGWDAYENRELGRG